MSKSIVSLVLVAMLSATTFAAPCTCIPPAPVTSSELLTASDLLIEARPMTRLPASVLLDNALVDNGHDAGAELQHAVIRINTHNLMHHDSRLVDLVGRIA